MFINEFGNLKEKIGCNMTEEGRSCPEHGIMECPGYKMIEASTQDKLYQRHQELRKKSGLPDPEYYKELKNTFDLPDDKRQAAVAALRKKYKVEGISPETSTQSDSQKYIQQDRGSTPPKTGTEKPMDVKPAQEPKAKKDPKDYLIKNEQVQQYTPKGVPLPIKQPTQQQPLNVPQGWEAKTQPDGSTRISKQGSMSSAEYKQNMADYKAKNWTPEKIADYSQRMASGQGYTDAERAANYQQQQQHFGQYADKPVDEAGPFSYGAKKPRKGSVADLAAKKRKEQERGKQPVEPKDQRVGVARVVKELDVKGASAGDKAAYDQYAQVRAKGDILDREASETPSPVSFAGSTQSGFNQDTRPHTKVHQSQLSKDLIAAQTTGLAAQNPEMEKRYTMNKLAVKPTKTNAEIAAQLESQGVAEGVEQYLEELSRAGYEVITETAELCPECGGPAFADRMLAEKQDACYHKVKSRYKVWPSAYASGALVRCRKVGAKNWGNKSKK